LALFNRDGEPNVTTVDISHELDISPGNLYYHFKGKDELVNELFERFYEQMNLILRAPQKQTLATEDYWFYLIVLFEQIYDYRFLYRNISLISQRYEHIKRPLHRLLKLTIDSCSTVCQQMHTAGLLNTRQEQIGLLANSMALTITYWFNFDNLVTERTDDDYGMIRDGVRQVMSLITPYLGDLGDSFLDAINTLYIKQVHDEHHR